MTKSAPVVKLDTVCFHCGNECSKNNILFDDKHFCCNGCQTVYSILIENNLGNYYILNNNPCEIPIANKSGQSYDLLNNAEINKTLVDFECESSAIITFFIPSIHCSSCLYLLENLHRINNGIQQIIVHYELKKIQVKWDKSRTNLKEIVVLLTSLGYEPIIQKKENSAVQINKQNRKRIYKIGLAGFAFANTMMFGIAEYVSVENAVETSLAMCFQYISLALATAVLFYSASEFFRSSILGIKKKFLNIDALVSVALIVTFTRSIYNLILLHKPGYFDSFCGIIFFMLLGRWIQDRVNKKIVFNRSFQSFFPIAVRKINDKKTEIIPIEKILLHDMLTFEENEVIAADGICLNAEVSIDYSFITGESELQTVKLGEHVYAGGKLISTQLNMQVTNTIEKGYFEQLWQHTTFKKSNKIKQTIYDTIAMKFTIVVLVLAIMGAFYWLFVGNAEKALNTITTVLIVACPCGLLLAKNFTLGNVIRIFNNIGFYVKSNEVISEIKNVSHIIFDKTGTLTDVKNANIFFTNKELDKKTMEIIISILHKSHYPLATEIVKKYSCYNTKAINNYKEENGFGISAWVNDLFIRIGSSTYTGCEEIATSGTKLYVAIDSKFMGCFVCKQSYILGISDMLNQLKNKFKLSILTGDDDLEKRTLQLLIGKKNTVLCFQKPNDKLEYVAKLNNKGNTTMMIGDGLNDAGSLQQSKIGIAVSATDFAFSPASDAVIKQKTLPLINEIISISLAAHNIVIAIFIFSVVYNTIGFYYAIQGTLSPMIAAVLMPLSTLTIIALSFYSTNFIAKRKFKYNKQWK